MPDTNRKNIWLFDIDGVLTHPQKKIVSDSLIKIIASRLKAGDSVAFVTGRSFNWTVEKVINKLKKELEEKYFKYVFISAEKGGVWGEYFDSNWAVHIDKKLAPPKKLTEKVAALVNKQFSKTMFIDEKETMISVEVIDGAPSGRFKKEQQKLDDTLRKYLVDFKLFDEFIVGSTLIGTDIQHKNSGKDLGATRVINWIRKQNATYKKYFAFGDTRSDVAMAQALYENKHDVQFVFTGDSKDLEGEKLPFPCKVYDTKYELGTLEFLLSLNLSPRT